MNILSVNNAVATQGSHRTRSPEETCRLAAALLGELRKGTVLALHGELGSGKTCFVRGLARALEINRPITSPTFTLINEYLGRWPLYHIDLYRMNSVDEIRRLGIEDYLETDGITAIEWAERAGDLLPEQTTHLYFTVLPDRNERIITIDQGHPPS